METLTVIDWIFDGTLAVLVVLLAWRALACPDLFKGVVFFIAFGLLMALVWVRLEAPDVALAEAAIGAGLTGALLLAALVSLGQGRGVDDQERVDAGSGPGTAADADVGRPD